MLFDSETRGRDMRRRRREERGGEEDELEVGHVFGQEAGLELVELLVRDVDRVPAEVVADLSIEEMGSSR